MKLVLRTLWCLTIIHHAAFTERGCVFELSCAECVPDNMPLVTSPDDAGVTSPGSGSMSAQHGDEVSLSCGAATFLLYPTRSHLTARCHAGKLRLHHDHTTRHLLELGCQESPFEDALYTVEHCSSPLQGRAYILRSGGRESRRLADICYDSDTGIARWARITPPGAAGPAGGGRAAPLSLLGNFNHMFDMRTRTAADRLYANDVRMTQRVRELLRADGVQLGEHALTSEPLLAADYYTAHGAYAASFSSGRVAVWRTIAAANMRALRHDVTRALRHHRHLHVVSGTLDVLSVRIGQSERTPLMLSAGRFPVPKYIWTVLAAPDEHRALVLVMLNDPFVSVSEIRSAVFCDSVCSRAGWLHELVVRRNYEVPSFGLVFCCSVHEMAGAGVPVPSDLLRSVPPGSNGLLLDLPAYTNETLHV